MSMMISAYDSNMISKIFKSINQKSQKQINVTYLMIFIFHTPR